MKFLLVMVAIWLLVWVLPGKARRARRRAAAQAATRPMPSPSLPAQTMLVCAYCGVHVPHSDALLGQVGAFCGAAHRAAFDAAHTNA